MNTKIFVYTGVLLILVSLGVPSIIGDDLTASIHQITIKTGDNIYTVQESITLQREHDGEDIGNVSCWIPNDAKDIHILFDGREITSYDHLGDNEYRLNVSGYNYTNDYAFQMEISYSLPLKTDEFIKSFVRPTETVKVSLDGTVIFTGENLTAGVISSIPLEKPGEFVVSWYVAIFIMLLLILLVVATVYVFRKRKTASIRDKAWKSKEVLATEKELLFDMLKELEKRYRSKKISDDTYHKLKSYYKHQTVEIMKTLDDIESKVK